MGKSPKPLEIFIWFPSSYFFRWRYD